MRLHPGVAYPLERFVPPEGAMICGVMVPGGTNVSVTAPVVHMDKTVYGDDAETFRPDRWLEADAEQLKLMERSFLAVSWSLYLSLYHKTRGSSFSRFGQSYLTDRNTVPVRSRGTYLHRQEHFDSRNGQVCPTDLETLRSRVGFGPARVEDRGRLVLETVGCNCQVQMAR